MKKKIIGYLLAAAVLVTGIGYLVNCLVSNIDSYLAGGALFTTGILKDWHTYGYGAIFTALLFLLTVGLGKDRKSSKKIMEKGIRQGDSPLENSRFMTDKERDKNFPGFTYDKAGECKKDGIPVMAMMDKKKLKVNICSGAHSLVIGSTGSGKTTTFINPMIQILAEIGLGSSMIMTDPKGELFSLHSKKLKELGYDVQVLDLRDTYSSSRWNPLESIWNMYQEYAEAGKGIKIHTDGIEAYDGLKKMENEGEYAGISQWYEYRGSAYASRQLCIDDISVARQKVYDEMYEDLNDLVSVLCPIESKDDPVWEKGARSIIMATLIAMLEDSQTPELGMTREKFNFFNLNKTISNSEDNFSALKQYFEGRDRLSTAVSLSRQVMSAADTTLSSYMSIAFDKLSMFNDRGLCALTSATDIDAGAIADRPTALFLKIPDEKDTAIHWPAFLSCVCTKR